MGKLRHRRLKTPEQAAQRAAATPVPQPAALGRSLHPTIPIPAARVDAAIPPLLSRDLGRESEWPGTALEEQNKTINHPCFTPAPVCRLSRVAL